MSRKHFVVGVCILVGIMFYGRPGIAQEQQTPVGITGIYEYQGVGPDGQYQGILEIFQQGEIYGVRWGFGENSYGNGVGGVDYGIGILNGKTLAVSFIGSAGAMLFRVDDKSTCLLVGEWIMIGSWKVYSETWRKLSEGEIETSKKPIPPQAPPPPKRMRSFKVA